jgi:hypothetical protein
MMTRRLASDICAAYDRLAVEGTPHPIHPFIGEAFLEPSDVKLRVMVVGINAYVDPQHEAITLPDAFAEWFRSGRYRYQKRLARELDALMTGMVARWPFLASRTVLGKESLYVTNAIKTYVPTARGKRADQIEERNYEEHLPVWFQELEVLAEHRAFPDVVVIVGAPFWQRACATFAEPSKLTGVEVEARRRIAGPGSAHALEVDVRTKAGVRTVPVMRLRHPAARTSKGSPTWLLDHAHFGGQL